MKTEFTTEPQAILYMPLPDGQADVWLRENITEVTDEDDESEGTKWTADEVYFRTELSMAEIEDDFDNLFESYSADSETSEITTEDRLDAIEAAILELAEVLANG